MERGWEVAELQVEQGHLDTVFRQITTAENGGEART